MVCVVALIMTWLFLAGLPGRIAIARKHPEAEAVKYLGYAGLLPTVYPWMQALIWAFKPTDIVDIRRFPREEAIETDKEIARLRGTPCVGCDEAVKESSQEAGRRLRRPFVRSTAPPRAPRKASHDPRPPDAVRLLLPDVADLLQAQAGQVRHPAGGRSASSSACTC
jgi:hypothetical protein